MPLPPASAAAADALFAAALRGEPPGAWPPGTPADLAAHAVMHGVETLLYQRLRAMPATPDGLLQALRRHAVAQSLWEQAHAQLLRAALPALADAGAAPLVFKGTALAYGVYTEPALRPRADTDLLVAPHAAEAARRVLLEQGYAPALSLGGLEATGEASFTRTLGGARHTIDLHWRLSNSPVLAALFTHDELAGRAIALPTLSPAARAPEAVDALLIAAFHRRSHVHAPYYVDGVPCRGDLRMVWLYDIDLLARGLGPAGWERLAARAGAKGLASITGQALQEARALFGTPAPPAGLAWPAPGGERPARYLAAHAAARQWMDVAALPDWRARLRMLAEVGIPSRGYMRQRYPHDTAPLAWLYLRRAWRGVLRLWGANQRLH